jgi:hypothetical protein
LEQQCHDATDAIKKGILERNFTSTFRLPNVNSFLSRHTIKQEKPKRRKNETQ